MHEYSKEVSDKQSVFIDNYLTCFNATEAARRAEYKWPNKIGPRILNQPHIQKEIQIRLNRIQDRTSTAFQKEIVRKNAISVERGLSKRGSVYLIGASNGLVKIGISVNIARRFKELDTFSPIPLELLFHRQVSNAKSIESALHSKFRERRVRGEWFELSDGDIQRAISLVQGAKR